MTEHNTVLQQPRTVAQQTQNSTRAGSHRLRNCGFPSSLRSVPDIVIDVLRSPGDPMDETVRREMESKIAGDFSDVRLHTGPKATAAAESIDARAFTYGKHIVFNQGEYRPETTAGKKLLVHELVHVVQQTGDAVRPEAGAGEGRAAFQHAAGSAVAALPPVTISSPDDPAEREAKRIAERVLATYDTCRCVPRRSLSVSAELPVSAKITTGDGCHSDAPERTFHPTIRVARCIHRQDTDELEEAMRSDVAEVPQNDKSIDISDQIHSVTQNKAFAVHDGDGHWNVAVPSKQYNLIQEHLEIVDVMTISDAKKRRREAKSEMRRILQAQKGEKHLQRTPWDKKNGIKLSDKRDAIMSGKPAGKKVGDGKRFIKGPVERHFSAATRALHPKYNNNVMNLAFQWEQFTQGLLATRSNRPIATYETPNNTYNSESRGSIEGWKQWFNNKDSVERNPVIYIVKTGAKGNPSKRLADDQPLFVEVFRITSLEWEASAPSTPSETECATLLGAALKYDEQILLGKTGLADEIFVQLHLDNAIRMLRQQDLSVERKQVKNLTSSSTAGPLEATLLAQTLLNMGKEVARAIHEMGLAALQYMNQNNKNLANVNFGAAALLQEFDDIGAEKQNLLNEYYTILKGIKKSQHAANKKLEGTIGTVFSVGGAAASTAAGAATGGVSILAQATIAAGITLVSNTLSSSVKKHLDGNTINPRSVMKDWVQTLSAQADTIIESKLTEQMDLKNTSNTAKQDSISRLVVEMKKELDAHVVSFT